MGSARPGQAVLACLESRLSTLWGVNQWVVFLWGFCFSFLSLCSYLDFLPWLPSGDRLSSGCVWWNHVFPLHVASGDCVFNSNSKNQAGCAWTEAAMPAKLCGGPLQWLESLCHLCCIISLLMSQLSSAFLVISEILLTWVSHHNAEFHRQNNFWHSLGIFVLPFVSWLLQRLSSDMRCH